MEYVEGWPRGYGKHRVRVLGGGWVDVKNKR